MDKLDSDNGLLRDVSGAVALRDIVQFVPFRDFEHVSRCSVLQYYIYIDLSDEYVKADDCHE